MANSTPGSQSGTAVGAVPVPLTVPLYVFPFQGGGFKIGIRVSFDDGATFHMYEFDTGGTGFWSAYDPTWWPNLHVVGSPVSITYSSGIQYTASPARANVTLENPALPPITAEVGQITDASKDKGNNPFTRQEWNAKVQAGTPPLYRHFFGDFGVALGSGNAPLFAVIPQIGGGLANGFIIDLGPYPSGSGTGAATGDGWVQKGTLQIGLTAADIAGFTTQIVMQGASAAAVPFPTSGMPTYTELLGQGMMTVSGNGVNGQYAVPTGMVFDTGAPTAEVHFGTVVTATGFMPYIEPPSTDLVAKVQFDLAVPAAAGFNPWNLSVSAGTRSGRDEVGTTSLDVNDAHPTGYVNTGLIPFFGNRVMFNLAGGTMGFAPAG